jgi:hypothetical protein
MKVFLGGTCNESEWRDELISMLNIDYFNPVVDDWTEECYQQELKERENCNFCLYVITPKMSGVYSIAEAVDDSNKKPEKTIFCVLEKDGNKSFTSGQMKSLSKVKEMIKENGGEVTNSLKETAKLLNKSKSTFANRAKALENLDQNEYHTLKKTGFLWVFYPEASGNWDEDCN